jgi:hypothetical protein
MSTRSVGTIRFRELTAEGRGRGRGRGREGGGRGRVRDNVDKQCGYYW